MSVFTDVTLIYNHAEAVLNMFFHPCSPPRQRTPLKTLRGVVCRW